MKHKDHTHIMVGYWAIRVFDDKTEALTRSIDIADLVASRVLEIVGRHLADDIISLEIPRACHALVMREIPELLGVGDGQSIFIERHSGETWPGPHGPGGGGGENHH